MKKVIVGFLILLSPLILILGIVIYINYILPIQKELQYYANREQQCEERADPVKFIINNLKFTIPADIFTPQSIGHCWGGGGYWDAWGCTKSQKVKSFYDKKLGKTVQGYCQSKNSPGFLTRVAVLNFKNANENGLNLRLNVPNMPDLSVELNEVTLSEFQRYSQNSYCSEVKNFNENADFKIKMFGNPIQINCIKDTRPEKYNSNSKLCTFWGVIGSHVNVISNKYFELNKIPREYWSSYFQQIELYLTKHMEKVPAPAYPDICQKLERQKNGRAH